MKSALNISALIFVLFVNVAGQAQYILEPVKLPKSINNEDYNAYLTISNDGKTLVFLRSPMYEAKNDGRWMWSQKIDGEWTMPAEISAINKTKSGPALYDWPLGFVGDTFYFMRRNDNKEDIYYKSKFDGTDFALPDRVNMAPYQQVWDDLEEKDKKNYGWKSTGPHINVLIGKYTYLVSPDFKVSEKLPEHVNLKDARNILPVGRNAIAVGNPNFLSLYIKSEGIWSDAMKFKMNGFEDCECLFLQSAVGSTLYFNYRGVIYSVELPEAFSEKIDFSTAPWILASNRNKANDEEEIIDLPQIPTYHALLIGIDDYKFNGEDLVDLSRPIQDAEALKDLLITLYNFSEENVTLMRNPNRAELIDQLERLAREVGEKDNLLVFYAGHGILDKELDVGYWLPADAQTSRKTNWISNSTIRNYIAGVQTQHTLLISDACFSGSIFTNRAVSTSIDHLGFNRLYKIPSRKAMTSGTLNSVPDESRFMKYLLKQLEENEDKYLPAKRLFYAIEPAVINNTQNIPQFGTIQNAGDEGGDFIFIRKQ